MLRNILWLAFVGILIMTFGAPPSLARPAEESRAFAQKVKQAVNELGIGEDVRVKIKLHDDNRIKGYISEISEDGFTVINSGSKTSTKIRIRKSNKLREIISQDTALPESLRDR